MAFDLFGLLRPRTPPLPLIQPDAAYHRTVIRFDEWRSERDFYMERSPVSTYTHQGNVLTSGGVNAIWSLVTGGTSPVPYNNTNSYIAMGSSTTAASSGQTALVSELGRKQATVTIQGVGITWTALFQTGDANGSWNEVGVSNASSAGTFIDRAVLSATVTKNVSNVYSVVLTITLG